MKVTVELPKPPEGYEWVPGVHIEPEKTFRRDWALRPILTTTVNVTMRREDAVALEKTLNTHNLHDGSETWYGRVKASTGAALAAAPVATCDVWLCRAFSSVTQPEVFSICKDQGSGTGHDLDVGPRWQCKLVLGHEGAHTESAVHREG